MREENPSVIGTTAKQLHLGLNVADLGRSVDFYRLLLGAKPTRELDDYARFEVADPPLVLALRPSPHGPGGAFNHAGFRVASSTALVEVQRRLEMGGIVTQREEGVECCYARQTKFWVPDPDGNLWEIYTLEEDLEHSGFGGDAGMPPTPKPPEATVTWDHMLLAPPPDRIEHEDGSVDQVRLEGSFNLPLEAPRRQAFIAEIWRVLRSKGTLVVHGLVSDSPFPGKPRLPGPAALVQRIPVETEAADELRRAGFVGLSFEKLGDIHCFQAGGVELREMRLTALKPALDDGPTEHGPAEHFVVYRGPLAQVEDETGRVFRCGERVAVGRSAWERLREDPYRKHFTCFRAAPAPQLTTLA